MNTKKSATLLSTVLLVSLLAGCSKSGDKATNPDKKDGTAVSTTDTSKPADGTTTAEAPKADGTKTDGAKPADATAESGTTPALPGQVKVSLNDLPDDMVICTVAGSPIKVADYKNMLKLQQVQLQQQITTDPLLQANLLQLAKQQHVTLTADEKTKLIATAKAAHGVKLADFLKQNNINETQFDSKVEEAGVQFKTANANLEQTLLPQLVSREIMANANVGRRKDAEASFTKFKTSPQFQAIKTNSGLTDEALRDELVKGEMAKFQIDKLSNSIKVNESDIKNFYNANKSKLSHDERIRLSSILMVAPEKDAGPIQSVRTQLKAAKPKMTDAELDKAAANFIEAQQNKALILLGQATAPSANFAKLANDNTQDSNSKTRKNGGDMGWKDKQQLTAVSPQFATAVWSLKPGTVLTQLVKDVEGFRIVRVTAHEQKGPVALSEVHDVIAAKIKQEKLNGVIQNWVAQQEQKTKIEFSKRFLATAQDKSNKSAN